VLKKGVTDGYGPALYCKLFRIAVCYIFPLTLIVIGAVHSDAAIIWQTSDPIAASPDPSVAAIGSTGYAFLGFAYSKAKQGDLIKVRDSIILEDLIVDRGFSIAISGGYDSDFQSRSGQPTLLNGKLIITSGSLVVDKLTITSVTVRVTEVWDGARHCIVLKSDATVLDWGINWYGMLGDNTVSTFSEPDFNNGSNDRHIPIKVHGPNDSGYLTGITAVMGGESHNFALKSDGTVWAWGWNINGQLGDGTTLDSNVPVQTIFP
jgi:hypothetical protein